MAGKELLQYGELLFKLKGKIKTAQQTAMLAVNNELLNVYWEIGFSIAEQEQLAGWGGKIIDKLAADLKTEFPTMKGLSPRNLRYMRDFALAYPNFLQQAAANTLPSGSDSTSILQRLAAKLPWGHHQVLLTKLKTIDERDFYIQKAVENGWSRSILEHHIESNLYKAQGALVHNFSNTMPAYQSELTSQVFKDPYNFDFIMLGEQAKERDLEDALITQVTKVLLELGAGFAFMGKQKRFDAGGKEFFVDLLFYHTKLRRHIIIELKIGEFEPEFVSKMNLYLGLADDQLKGEFDEPAIGLILCKTNNKVIAEYALRDTSKPIGIAEYKIAEKLPENIRGELPSIEEIELRVDEEIKEAQNPIDSRLQSLKEKIKNIKTEEIRTPATYPILYDLYINGLKPLYKNIEQKLQIFDEDFYSINRNWQGATKHLDKYEQLDEFWGNEEQTKQIHEFSFTYSLNGFKKAGIENFGESLWLKFRMDTYSYGFILVNHNNQQAFLKKLYHQPITESDIQIITNLMMNQVMDRIDWILKYIENNSIDN
ncbi:MAG: DUF1016 domain-containing protein [Bacteroidetes bacterium]|nr:DUF1016 domain-containing protein [Bacteroidota bacterium]